MQASFREILEKKLGSPLENDISLREKSQFSDPFALSFLMGTIPQFKYKTGQYQSSFSRTQQENAEPEQEAHSQKTEEKPTSKTTFEPTISKAKPEPVITLDSLSPQGIAAIYVLKGLGAIIEESFCESELKKQYRRLLLRYHPDHNDGATLEEFFDLRQAYDSVTSELDGI